MAEKTPQEVRVERIASLRAQRERLSEQANSYIAEAQKLSEEILALENEERVEKFAAKTGLRLAVEPARVALKPKRA